jgi:hypothetical protein
LRRPSLRDGAAAGYVALIRKTEKHVAMRISLFAVGRLKSGPESDLSARYLDRFAKSGGALGLDFARVIEVAESRAATAELRKREEAAQLERHACDGAALILLDERGKTPDSPGFADHAGTAIATTAAAIWSSPSAARTDLIRICMQGRRRDLLRPHDLAAPAGAHHGSRAALPRGNHSPAIPITGHDRRMLAADSWLPPRHEGLAKN